MPSLFVRMEPRAPPVRLASPASVWPATQAPCVSTIRTNVLQVRVCTETAPMESTATTASALMAMMASVPLLSQQVAPLNTVIITNKTDAFEGFQKCDKSLY